MVENSAQFSVSATDYHSFTNTTCVISNVQYYIVQTRIHACEVFEILRENQTPANRSSNGLNTFLPSTHASKMKG